MFMNVFGVIEKPKIDPRKPKIVETVKRVSEFLIKVNKQLENFVEFDNWLVFLYSLFIS